jgi:predicted nucleic acid-binding protein
MKKVKIYFDTSVISFLFADDSPDFKSITINFFENYSKEYDLYISEIVLLEINKNTDELLKTDMLNIIDKYNIQTLEYNLEIDEIAKKYILSKIIPERKIEDALHVAYTTYYEIDILLSWNFKHLANIKKEYEE